MFEQSTLLNTPRNLWATCAGFGVQAAVVLSLVLVPLVWPQVIPPLAYMIPLTAPGPPPGPPRKGTEAHPQHHSATPRPFHPGGMTTPAAIPQHAIAIVDPPPELGEFGVPGGIENGVPGGMPGVLASIGPDLHPPVVERPPEPVRPPAPVVAAAIPRYRVGGLVHLAEPIFRPEPVYPAMARSMRVAGVVELIAVIGTDGRIRELRLKTGHPLLARAAIEAVSRWIYTPTTLNGVPVEVESPIIVTFKLGN